MAMPVGNAVAVRPFLPSAAKRTPWGPSSMRKPGIPKRVLTGVPPKLLLIS